jgi:hypothetical protein
MLQVVSENEGSLPDDIDDFCGFRGEGEMHVMDVLALLKGELEALIPRKGMDQQFDSRARELVHAYLSNVDTQILLDPDFWRYLSGVYFYDIVQARHPESQKRQNLDSNWANFGGKSSNISESLIYRLFLGADLSIDHENRTDPYHLSRIHDVDLWQSHIIRVLSGENPIYVRALLSWFRERDEWYAKQKNEFEWLDEMGKYENFKTRHLRDFVKRVRRLRSNVIHEFLTSDEVKSMVNSLAKESLSDSSSWVKEKSTAPKTSS